MLTRFASRLAHLLTTSIMWHLKLVSLFQFLVQLEKVGSKGGLQHAWSTGNPPSSAAVLRLRMANTALSCRLLTVTGIKKALNPLFVLTSKCSRSCSLCLKHSPKYLLIKFVLIRLIHFRSTAFLNIEKKEK